MPRGATALLSTITVLLLAGCAPDNGTAEVAATDETPGSATPASEATTTQAPTAEVQGFAAGTAPQSGAGSRASGLVLADVRLTAGEDFDRIVLEFKGNGTPGWVVSYVDDAVLDGSGEVVDLGGDATLDIYASGTTWPAPGYYDGPAHLVPKSSGSLTDVYVGGTFEGTTQVLAGIDSAASFRVSTRTAPSRLVIDVTNRGDENAD